MSGKAKRQALSQDRQIRALKTEAETYEHAISGTNGLRIRVSPSGRRSWFYRYRNRESGKLERIKLGEYRKGGMSLADARVEAEQQRAIANEHGSAKAYRDSTRADQRAALTAKLAEDERARYTVKAMVDEYLDDASDSLRSWREVDRALKKYVIPELGSRPAHEVTRRDVIAMLDKLNKAGKRTQSNRVLAYLRRAFNWAIAQDRLSANPCQMIERNAEKPKERALGDAEIRRFLTNLPDTEIEPAVADAYRLILLTGLRPGEAARLSFDDIDEEEATITIRNTKNDRDHVLPATAQVLEIVKRRREGNESRYLFPALRDDKRPMRADALPGPLRDAIPKLKIMPATPHDLRRSFATGLARIGARRLLISLALNHTIGGVTGIYDRYSYQPELSEWLTKWADHVDGLTKPKKDAKAKAA